MNFSKMSEKNLISITNWISKEIAARAYNEITKECKRNCVEISKEISKGISKEFLLNYRKNPHFLSESILKEIAKTISIITK